uniref:GST N-terminal domain-containing protein n=1 Tax=Sander lucioperca TaxID=283035 RepID=A0A8C9Y1U7_SANLU
MQFSVESFCLVSVTWLLSVLPVSVAKSMVMTTLKEKKLQGYKHKLLSFEKGEHKSQEVLEINPRGQLPALKHEDNILNESACLYLEVKLYMEYVE